MEETKKVKITAAEGVRLPAYETAGSAGMDIRARLADDVTIPAGGRALIPTGLFIQLPAGYEAQIRARSGLAVKNGIALINGVGTIDSDYRGEIRVGLINLGQEAFTVRDGERIAQMVVARYERVEWEAADVLEDTDRGSGGFGHTGL